jgi:hypothetical protein
LDINIFQDLFRAKTLGQISYAYHFKNSLSLITDWLANNGITTISIGGNKPIANIIPCIIPISSGYAEYFAKIKVVRYRNPKKTQASKTPMCSK